MIKLKTMYKLMIRKRKLWFIVLSYIIQSKKSRSRKTEIKAINILGVIKNELVCCWWFINVDDELLSISLGNSGGRGGGIRR